MENILMYVFKVNLLLIFFTVFYLIFLKKETFFKLIRYYFIVGIIISLILPIIYTYKTLEIIHQQTTDNEQKLVNNTTQAIVKEEIEHLFTVENVLLAFYIIGLLWMLFRFIKALYKLTRIIVYSKRDTSIRGVLYNRQINNAFSFIKWIILPAQYQEMKDIDTIIIHEKVHVKQGHSFDILFMEILHCFFWINPAIIFMKKSIRLNLEYLVDAEVTKETHSYTYQKTLLTTLAVTNNKLATSFNAIEVKKRIIMLNTQKSKNMKKLKFTLALPFIALFFISFQIKTVAQIRLVEASKVTSDKRSVMTFYLYPGHEKEDFKKMEDVLKKMYKINARFSNIQRKNNQVVSFDIHVKNGKENYTRSFGKKTPFTSLALSVENKGNKKYDLLLNEQIEGFSSQTHNQASKNASTFVITSEKKPKNEIVLIKNTDPATTAATAVVEITDGETVFIQSDQPVYFIDGKKVSKDELSKILPDEIQLIEINRNNEVENNAQDSRGTIRITTKRNNASVKAEQASVRLQKQIEYTRKEMLNAESLRIQALQEKASAFAQKQIVLSEKQIAIAQKIAEKYSEKEQKRIEVIAKKIEESIEKRTKHIEKESEKMQELREKALERREKALLNNA